MRLRLASRFRLLRRQKSTPFAKHAPTETASSSDANRRLFSSLNAAWLLPTAQQKLPNSGTNGIASACAVGGHRLLKPCCNPTLEFLRTFRDGDRGWRTREEGPQVVNVSSDVWQLLKEYDVPATIADAYRVHIETAPTTSKEVQLTLCGRNAAKVAAMLVDPPQKLELRGEGVSFWLTGKGRNGTRFVDIQKRSGALVKPSKDNKSVLLVGPSKTTLAATSLIDACDCIEEFEVDSFVGFYLINNRAIHQKRLGVETDSVISCLPKLGATKWKAVAVGPTESVKRLRRKLEGLYVERRRITQAVRAYLAHKPEGAECDRATKLNRKFGTYFGMGPIGDDPARMVDITVVGERRKNADQVFAAIDGLHIKLSQIPQAVYGWLSNTSEGSECARSLEFSQKSDTTISMGAFADDCDPARMMDIVVVGEREENVDDVLATIAGIVVEKANISKLQEEFLMGHKDEQVRNRPHHKLEYATNTFIASDFGACCLHVAGRPEDVKDAVKRIRKCQYIKLRNEPSEISLAAGTYITRIRDKLESDNLQIHLRPLDTRPGACELRRLHLADGERDDAKADEADKKLMREIDLYEVVLDVHKSWARLLHERCDQIKASECVGIGISKDALNGRVLVDIAGSRSTVKRGMQVVIRMLASARRYREDDIRLRRIEGQSVDAAGFEEAGEVSEEDLSNCKESFDWERLTREQWRYTGRSSSERKRTPSTKPKQNKASENAKMDRS